MLTWCSSGRPQGRYLGRWMSDEKGRIAARPQGVRGARLALWGYAEVYFRLYVAQLATADLASPWGAEQVAAADSRLRLKHGL